jgi:hypothetical protein
MNFTVIESLDLSDNNLSNASGNLLVEWLLNASPLKKLSIDFNHLETNFLAG